LSNARISTSDFEFYCPVCTRCFAGNPELCPECASPRPGAQWQPINTSTYLYLGKELDGRYVIDRFVGAGATGDVYRAIGTRIQRPFALKIVDTRRYGRQDIEEELARRLQMEVDAMSRLRNPHVVNAYEMMQISDQIFVMVMDFVDGITLLERLEQIGRMEVEESAEIVRQVANGLHEAHQRGIIHRDIKPDNIMIEQMPASGVFARVLDFGIAYMVDSVRVTSGFRGTPLYASPEQCQSDGVLGPFSDVYSLGCVLFHLLTGRAPYVFDRALAVMEGHIEAPIPSVFEFLSPNQVPVEYDELLTRMLAKDPADRPRDGGAVVRELDAIARALRARATVAPGIEPPPANAPSEVGAEETHTHAPAPIISGPQLSRASDTVGIQPPTERPHAQRIVRLVASIALPAQLANPAREISAQVVGPGGDYAVFADGARQVHLIGLKTDLAALTFSSVPGLLHAVCVDAHRGDVYAGGDDHCVFRWNMGRTNGVPQKVVDVGAKILTLDVHPAGSKLAIGTADGRALIYDLRTQRTNAIYITGLKIRMMKFVPNSKRVLIGCESGRLGTVLDERGITAESSRVVELEPLDSPIISAAVSPNGDLAAILEETGRLRIFDMMERAAFLRVEASYAPLTALAFSASGSLNALGMTDEELQLWSIRQEQLVRHLSGMSQAMSE